jgi:hypothetical protein
LQVFVVQAFVWLDETGTYSRETNKSYVIHQPSPTLYGCRKGKFAVAFLAGWAKTIPTEAI